MFVRKKLKPLDQMINPRWIHSYVEPYISEINCEKMLRNFAGI